jgi:hypothetical protein
MARRGGILRAFAPLPRQMHGLASSLMRYWRLPADASSLDQPGELDIATACGRGA